MKSIQMVDLLGQYHRIQNEIDDAVLGVIKSSAYINGPEVQEFKKELSDYLGVRHVIPCGNGTDALQLALMALDLKPGDEVITPSFTYIATAEAICLLGGTPVFVDVDPITFNIDPKAITASITNKTKAIIGVHLYGQSFNHEAVATVANEYNLPIIEDAAQSMGCAYTNKSGLELKTGNLGTIGCTSFFPSKNLGGYGDGGAIFTNNDELAEKMAMLANHGQSKRYHHRYIGINSRLDSIQAAILRVKLRYLDTYNEARQAAAANYDQLLSGVKGIVTPSSPEFTTHVYHQYTLKLTTGQRDGLSSHLEKAGIPCPVYYPLAIHQQESFKSKGFLAGRLDVTEQLSKEVFSLPMHTELTVEQQEYIADHIVEYLGKNG